MSIAEQFAGLDMESLIDGPLTAAEDDSNMLARSTANFIDDVCVDTDGKGRATAFENEKHSASDDGTRNPEEKKVDVPMLTIVPIPGMGNFFKAPWYLQKASVRNGWCLFAIVYTVESGIARLSFSEPSDCRLTDF